MAGSCTICVEVPVRLTIFHPYGLSTSTSYFPAWYGAPKVTATSRVAVLGLPPRAAACEWSEWLGGLISGLRPVEMGGYWEVFEWWVGGFGFGRELHMRESYEDFFVLP